jgi:hypothetical protein
MHVAEFDVNDNEVLGLLLLSSIRPSGPSGWEEVERVWRSASGEEDGKETFEEGGARRRSRRRLALAAPPPAYLFD